MSSEIAAVPDDAVLPARLARQFRRLCDISQVALARDAQINYTRLVQFEQQRGHLTHEERQRVLAVLLPKLGEALEAWPPPRRPTRPEEEASA